MTQTRFRLGCELVFLILMAVAAEPAYATGPDIKVSFQGTSGLNGYFIYDSSLPGSGGSFSFTGLSTYVHATCFMFRPGTCPLYVDLNCEPFVINTSLGGGTVFQVLATGPKTTALTINLATTCQLNQSALPTCETACFVPNPSAGASTFTMQPAGGAANTYNITSVTCTVLESTAAVGTPVPCYAVYGCPAPTPCPVYVCPPRPACCLSRLFSRCTFRARCW